MGLIGTNNAVHINYQAQLGIYADLLALKTQKQ